MDDVLPKPAPFLDVPTLLDRSWPAPRHFARWVSGALLGLMILLAVIGANQPLAVRQNLDLFGLVLLALIMTAGVVRARGTVRRHAAAKAGVDAIEELIQLRRWEQAVVALEQLLSQPTPSHRVRTGALLLLAPLLARYDRFEDAMTVQDHLLAEGHLGDGEAYGLRLARAMAMLKQDHLVDANAALSDLRRRADGSHSAGLTLLEIYRDVKTGHPAEALETFSQRLPLLQRQMGHRLADVYALAARAHDQLGQTAQAAIAYDAATRLAPPGELYRRYPELSPLAGRYQPAVAPAEAA